MKPRFQKLTSQTLVLAALLTGTSAFAQTPTWTVSEASGPVTIERDGRALVARKDSKLQTGDTIRTGAKARAVLVRGKEFVVVSPGAKLTVSEPEETGGVIQFFQSLGNALFKIEKKSTQHFGVQTPYLAAVVKGTTFNVSVSEEQSRVQVTEGAVEVATSSDLEAALLTPGMIGVVDGGQVEDLIVVADASASDLSTSVVRGTPEFVSQLPNSNREPDAGPSATAEQGGVAGPRSRRPERPEPQSGPGDELGPQALGETAVVTPVAFMDDEVSGGDDSSETVGEDSAA